MPANVVSLQNNRMHMTNAEKEARAEAEQSLRRDAVNLKIPFNVGNDTIALDAWERIVKDLEEIELLDNLDVDMLGTYCLCLSRVDMLQRQYGEYAARGSTKSAQNTLKNLNAQEKILLSYADKLGLTPSARAKIAVKKAKQAEIDKDDDIYGG